MPDNIITISFEWVQKDLVISVFGSRESFQEIHLISKSISSEEYLILSLKYLASAENQQSLSFSFRIAKNSSTNKNEIVQA